jgi:hypothetical protein
VFCLKFRSRSRLVTHTSSLTSTLIFREVYPAAHPHPLVQYCLDEFPKLSELRDWRRHATSTRHVSVDQPGCGRSRAPAYAVRGFGCR